MLVTILVALGIVAAGGLGALAAASRPRLANGIGALGSIAGCALGLAGLAAIRIDGSSPALRLPWAVPYGELHLSIDPLASFFLLLIFLICPLAALYGWRYLPSHAGGRRLGPPWFFFNLLTISMALVVMAANGVLFLVAWETMALSSFFLVTFDDAKQSAREAGWIYLVATHTGTVFLLLLFVLLARESGSMDFEAWRQIAALPPATAGAMFLLAVIGFGAKAGIVPFHVWLPEAHPAAPSHVSAVMSGVMIKTGVYGLLRALAFFGTPPAWWAVTLLGIGIVSGLLGVLFALAQPDMKRALAYSSVENVGIIFLGVGLGALGLGQGLPALAALGFAGALLHTMNHALFKGLLFMGAGAVIHEAGTGELDRLGGLIKRMPVTAAACFVGAAAIAGLPPLNGFLGEFVIYLASLEGARALGGARGLIPLASLVGLALVGGLAAACFVRLFGVVFLGAPRTAAPAAAREPSGALRAPMIALAIACAVLGLAPAPALRLIAPAAGSLASLPADQMQVMLSSATESAAGILLASAILLALLLLIVVLRSALLSGREVRRAVTWDCGYARPTARMQHTALSLTQPISEAFPIVLPGRPVAAPPEGYFPVSASLRTEIARPFQERLYRPAFEAVGRGMARMRWLQHGRVQLYVLYIVVTLIALLSWFLAL